MTMQNRSILDNANILFICPNFFDHNIVIMNEMISMGAKVDFFTDRPTGFFKRIIKSQVKTLYKKIIDDFHSQILNRIESKNYDYVFVIRGESLTEIFLNNVRRLNPNAYFVMYQWDSLINNDYSKLVKCFNKTYSFDSVDSKNNIDINYLPLFYNKEYKEIRSVFTHKYQFTFVGQFLEERYQLLKRLEVEFLNNGIPFLFYIYIEPLKLIKLILKLRFTVVKDLRFRSLKRLDIVDIFKDSKCIIDIPSPTQSGLTMRTIEAIGSHRCLLTTNSNIVDEPFFGVDYISVMNKSKINIESLFNESCIFPECIDNYDINNWIRTIFSNLK